MQFCRYVAEKVKELCGIDIRSLALFRIGLALILLRDLYVRIQEITAHYSDGGVLPRDLLIAETIDSWHFSLHLINGTPQFQIFLFLLAAIAAFSLLFGYRTRLSTVCSWILLISMHSRNPLILQGGDVVLRLLLFWGIFLPLGACWSVDASFQKEPLPKNQIVSMGSFALLLQICFIYWFSALLKTDPSWQKDGTAVWLALNIEHFTTPFGKVLLNFPTLLKISSFATLYLETLGPFFAFSPIWTGQLRFATAIVFMIFHLVILNVAMDLGIFVYVCAVAWLVFIPGWFWDHFLPKEANAAIAWKARRWSNGIAMTTIAYIFLWNVRSIGISVPILTPLMSIPGSILRLDQYWNMFAPRPIIQDGWYVIPGKLRDHAEVDLFKEGLEVSWEKPPLILATYKNDRWRAYMMYLYYNGNTSSHLLHYGRYLTREWNKNHPYDKQMMTFDIIFMMKVNALQGITTPTQVKLWHHECFLTEDEIDEPHASI